MVRGRRWWGSGWRIWRWIFRRVRLSAAGGDAERGLWGWGRHPAAGIVMPGRRGLVVGRVGSLPGFRRSGGSFCGLRSLPSEPVSRSRDSSSVGAARAPRIRFAQPLRCHEPLLAKTIHWPRRKAHDNFLPCVTKRSDAPVACLCRSILGHHARSVHLRRQIHRPLHRRRAGSPGRSDYPDGDTR